MACTLKQGAGGWRGTRVCQGTRCCSCPSTEGGAKGAVPVDSLRNKGWRGSFPVCGCVRGQGQLGHRATGQSAKPKSAIGGGPGITGQRGTSGTRQKSNWARGQQHNRATGQHTMLHTSGRIPLLNASISVQGKYLHHLSSHTHLSYCAVGVCVVVHVDVSARERLREELRDAWERAEKCGRKV